jgi:hypothetical protein
MDNYVLTPCSICKVRWPKGALTKKGVCPDCNIFYGNAPVIEG